MLVHNAHFGMQVVLVNAFKNEADHGVKFNNVTPGRVYTVLRVDGDVFHFHDDVNKIRKFKASRFEEHIVAPAPAGQLKFNLIKKAPAEIEVHQVGDVVVVLNGSGNQPLLSPGWMRLMDRMIGKEYKIEQVIEKDNGKKWYRLEGDINRYQYDEAWLKAVIPTVDRFEVGDIVQLIKGYGRYLVDRVYPDGKIGLMVGEGFAFQDHKGFDGIGQGYDFDRFEFHKDCERCGKVKLRWINNGIIIPAEPVFKIGDCVQVVKKVEEARGKTVKWVDGMTTDFVAGRIEDKFAFNGSYILDNGFAYLPECFKAFADEAAMLEFQRVNKVKIPTKKEIAAMMDREAADFNAGAFGGTCSYSVISQDNKGNLKAHRNFNDACHYRIRRDAHYGMKDGAWTKTLGIVDFVGYGERDMSKQQWETYKKWIDYTVNRSPFAIAFEQASVEDICKNGVRVNVNVPSDVIAGALITLRYLKEHRQYCDAYQFLTDNNVDEAVAQLLAYNFRKHSKGVWTSGMRAGHCALNDELKAGPLLTFYANGYGKATMEQKPYSEHTNYQVFEAFNKTEDVTGIKGTIAQLYKKNLVQEEEGAGWNSIWVSTDAQVLALAEIVTAIIVKARESIKEIA